MQRGLVGSEMCIRDSDKAQQALGINSKLISIAIDKLDIEINNLKSTLKISSKYESPLREEGYYNRKLRSSSQTPIRDNDEMWQKLIDLQSEMRKLAEEVRKKDLHMRDWEQIIMRKDRLTLQMLDKMESGSNGTQYPFEEIKRKDDTIRRLQSDLESAAYSAQKKREESDLKPGYANMLLDSVVSQIDKFLLSMQRLQRGVSKHDNEAVPALKEEFERNKKELIELAHSVRPMLSNSQDQYNKSGKIIQTRGTPIDPFRSTVPLDLDDSMSHSITRYKIKPVAPSPQSYGFDQKNQRS
eukprot:TRINITY_DN13406_c0_g1_i5.p1 TRINITY_DN13406_c0_g1~~TRINITY_DN13406_c0_g1_i5.p1  ORF type:complete len:299 (-),score=53.50 TRINITY_DN13406_c0_g1_i5:437-1333(-)